MLEAAIPALWSAVHGWFTPAVFFVVLNIVIGTIAVTSKVAAPGPAAAGAGEAEGDAAAAGAGWEQQPRRLARVPSMAFDRLRSFNLRSLAAAAPDPEPEPGVAVDLGYVEQEQQPPALEPEPEEEPARVVERQDEPLPELEPEPEPEHAAPHVERSRSEAAAAAELPRLPARLHKSASDKSAFAHFGAEEVEEAVRAVEARRPATTRELRAPARRAPVEEPEQELEDSSELESEVDARADAFINRFHHQLKLQRIDSFIRHRETLRRGQAAAGAAV